MQTFYKDLPRLSGSLIQLLEHEEQFVDVPDSRAVLIVDVKDSTKAIKLVYHHEVNPTAIVL